MDVGKRNPHPFAKFLLLRKDFKGFARDGTGFGHFFVNFFQIFLNKGSDEVDNAKATVGTSELRNGFGSFATKKNKVMTI